MNAWITGLMACSRLMRSPSFSKSSAQHRGRKVDRQHDVVALGANFALVLDALGPGERDDEERQSQERQADRPAR